MNEIIKIRIQHAQELLESTDEKLESIAPQVVYESAHVFSRAFARCVGMTPSGYRSRHWDTATNRAASGAASNCLSRLR
jgi:transcriptional regulator GlxA family with amidase domain